MHAGAALLFSAEPAASARAHMLHLLHPVFRVARVAGTFQEPILRAAVAHRHRAAVAAL